MAGNLRGRHFLKLLDFSPEEIRDLLTPATSPSSGAVAVSAGNSGGMNFTFVNEGTISTADPGSFGADMAEGFIARVDEALGNRTDRERRFRGDVRLTR